MDTQLQYEQALATYRSIYPTLERLNSSYRAYIEHKELYTVVDASRALPVLQEHYGAEPIRRTQAKNALSTIATQHSDNDAEWLARLTQIAQPDELPYWILAANTIKEEFIRAGLYARVGDKLYFPYYVEYAINTNLYLLIDIVEITQYLKDMTQYGIQDKSLL